MGVAVRRLVVRYEPDPIDAAIRLAMAVVALLALLTIHACFWWEVLT